MRKIERIYFHCSGSEWGDVETIRSWHVDPFPRGRGWSDIGYHYVITNLFPQYMNWKDSIPMKEFDGAVWEGRPLKRVGAHVQGDNKDTVGVCLVGNEHFSCNQIDAGAELAAQLCRRFGLKSDDVVGHREYWLKRGETPLKTCPNFNDMDLFRKVVAGFMVNSEATDGNN